LADCASISRPGKIIVSIKKYAVRRSK